MVPNTPAKNSRSHDRKCRTSLNKEDGKTNIEVDLSFIIVSWNAKAFLLECLYSLKAETFNAKTEFIVVDNASIDNSPEAVHNQFPDVRIIRNDTNIGFARANNIGIQASKGRYLCLVNSDIKVLEGCITRIWNYMNRHPSIGILGPQILNPDGSLQPSCKGLPTLWNSFCRALALDTLVRKSRLFGSQLMNYWAHDSLRVVDVLSGCFWMVRREALNEVGLLDERFFIYSEDKDWCKRFHDHGWDVMYFPDARAIHYGGGSSSNAPTKFYLEMLRANLQYWRKYHGLPSLYVFWLIILLHHATRMTLYSIMYFMKPSKRKAIREKIKMSYTSILWLIKLYKLLDLKE